MASSDAALDVADLVPLVDGPIVPSDAYRLRLDLADRGFTLTRASDTTIRVSPPGHLTPEDRAAITRWKWHLLLLLDYEGRTDFDAFLQAACHRRPA